MSTPQFRIGLIHFLKCTNAITFVFTEEFMMNNIKKCRVSGGTDLETVMSLGQQVLMGVFPQSKDDKPTSGPVDLLW